MSGGEAEDDGVGGGSCPGWTEEDKALAVRESCWPGVAVSDVAWLYGVSMDELKGWRELAWRGKLTKPRSARGAQAGARARRLRSGAAAAGSREPAFATVAVEAGGGMELVTIEARGMTVRLEGEVGVSRIAEIALALRGQR